MFIIPCLTVIIERDSRLRRLKCIQKPEKNYLYVAITAIGIPHVTTFDNEDKVRYSFENVLSDLSSGYLVSKLPTIVDVAKLAGVSKATVGRVVNGQDDIVSAPTRLRVLDAIDQLGYERNAVAGSLRTSKTYMIALVIPDITNPFWPAVARGVQDTLEKYNYTVVTVNSDWDASTEAKYLKMVRSNRFDGVIINPTDASVAETNELDIPVVILGNSFSYPEYDSVGSDSASGVETSLEYLFELGHRRIGLISGLSVRRKVKTRYHSYLSFLARHQLQLDEDLVVYGDFTIAAGADAMRTLLNLPNPPTAVFAANDILAIGAMQTAQELGWHIPEDISIIGMDNILASEVTSPPLTTVAKPKYEIGAQAAKLLLEQLQHPEKHSTVLGKAHKLPCTLVKRGSVAIPRT